MKFPIIAVVVLNYNNFNDTIECVNSILNQTYKNYYIVIVENGSVNNSHEELINIFKDFSSVTILKNEINLGFAKGNNVGIKYATKNLNCNFVFVLNSDTIVDKNLLKEVSEIKIERSIGIISPTVLFENGEQQVPSVNFSNIKKDTLKSCFRLIYGLLLYSFVFRKLYTAFKNKNTFSLSEPNYIYKTYALQGSSFFLTPNFFKFYTQLYPQTFLYWEEINLMWYLYKVNLKTQMINSSPVIHKESRSVNLHLRPEKIVFWKLKMSFESMLKSIPMFFLSYEKIRNKY